MKNKSNKDVLKIFDKFQKTIGHKPSAKEMFTEVQMMKFRVKPMQGDIAAFDLKNGELIEALWSLGKLDELYQKEYHYLSTKEKNLFFRIFDELYHKFQSELNRIHLKHGPLAETSSILEMEIFRERRLRKDTN